MSKVLLGVRTHVPAVPVKYLSCGTAQHSGSAVLPTQLSRVRFLAYPNLFKFHVAEIYQHRHSLESVDNANA